MDPNKVLQDAKDKVTEKMNELDTNQVMNEVKKTAEEVRANAEETIADAKQELREIHRDTKAYIKRNPEKSVAIAAGVGAALAGFAALLLGKNKK